MSKIDAQCFPLKEDIEKISEQLKEKFNHTQRNQIICCLAPKQKHCTRQIERVGHVARVSAHSRAIHRVSLQSLMLLLKNVPAPL